MCGIFVIRSNFHNEKLKGKVEKCINSIKHRGGDDTCIYADDKSKTIFTHTRLSIVGIDNGQQPITNNSVTICVNGEFYGYSALKTQLSLDYKFKTDSDSELLIPLYLKYGFKLFDYLNGEFSFVLYDHIKEIYIASRDRFGIKPLSYYRDKDVMIFSSEVKAIREYMNISGLNKHALSSFFACVPQSNISVFNNIKHVSPAHFITYMSGKLSEHKYWSLNNEIYIPYNEAYLANKFRKILAKSVEDRMVADVDVGCYLSGGLDSSSILSLASKINPKIKAYNIAFTEKDYNENKYAKIVSDHLNVELNTLVVTEQMISDNFEMAVLHREAPVYQLAGVAKFLLSDYVRNQGVKAVLTGEGADEILLGYQYFREDIGTINRDTKIADMLRSKYKKTSSAYISCGQYKELDFIKNSLGYVPAQIKLGYDVYKTISDSLMDIYSFDDIIKTFISNIDFNSKHNISNSLIIWMNSLFPENILSYLGDRMEMAHGVEGRVPFLDVNLVDFVSSLNNKYKINNNIEKYLLKKSMYGLLPEEIINRDKHIFSSPPISINSPIYIHFMDIINSLKFNNFIFKSNEVKKLFINKKDSRQNMINSFVICLIISSYYLNKNFINN
jgi:asparagine synthase (glutamine-hydrolysing)